MKHLHLIILFTTLLLLSCTNTYSGIIKEESLRSAADSISLNCTRSDTIIVAPRDAAVMRENYRSFVRTNDYFIKMRYYCDSSLLYSICYDNVWVGDENGVSGIGEFWMEDCKSKSLCDSVENSIRLNITPTNHTSLSEGSTLGIILGSAFGGFLTVLVWAVLRNY